jgi:hypothetical protein
VSTYTYYFMDADGSIPSFEITELATDDEACRRAPDLLKQRPARQAVEVWREATCLKSLGREALA